MLDLALEHCTSLNSSLWGLVVITGKFAIRHSRDQCLMANLFFDLNIYLFNSSFGYRTSLMAAV